MSDSCQQQVYCLCSQRYKTVLDLFVLCEAILPGFTHLFAVTSSKWLRPSCDSDDHAQMAILYLVGHKRTTEDIATPGCDHPHAVPACGQLAGLTRRASE